MREEKKNLKIVSNDIGIFLSVHVQFAKRVIGRAIATASRFHKLWLFHDEQQPDAALRLKLATRRTATRKLIDAQENNSGGEDGS